MSSRYDGRPPTRRPPLVDSTRRVINQFQFPAEPAKEATAIPHHESLKPDGLLQNRTPHPAFSQTQKSHPNSQQDQLQGMGSTATNAANPRLSAISKESQAQGSNRNSQISTTSTNASDGRKRKTHIGPWNLGKTLGKGATARVRKARHAYTGQHAAIKIVQKKHAQMSQAGSLAQLDQAEASMPDPGDGLRRMPFGIEREVAIMKLIEHPNIMKLYDIWENRTEIYLVLEFVDNGELFEHISRKGRLREEEAIKYFRQILSAVGYCHSFKICHRDLKPENILMTKDGSVKIADFGMAALHQTQDHRLSTSCGSPHYAAPEVIRAAHYRGDKVDIWSMGVILYASLAGRLPFDHEHLPRLLALIKRGEYQMAHELTIEAKDLIRRILRVTPRDRLTIDQIWRHPLIRRYDYLDDYGVGETLKAPLVSQCGRPVERRSDIDRELLRHLRSMWHTFDERQLVQLLLNEEPNEQKLFYGLLVKYRESQLENYTPDLDYSTSDYHHARPLANVQKLSTRNFPQAKTKGHSRQVSRFTVISNASNHRLSEDKSHYAPTEAAETVKSYDPFRASRPQHLVQTGEANFANVTIHRDHQALGQGNAQNAAIVRVRPMIAVRQPSRGSGTSSMNSRGMKLVPPRLYASRSSLASSTRSRSSANGVRAVNTHRRGVSFNHLRNRSSASQRNFSAPVRPRDIERHSRYSEVTDDGGDVLRAITSHPAARYVRSRKIDASPLHASMSADSPQPTSPWKEDVRQLSSSLANACDEAFNRSSVASRSSLVETTRGSHAQNKPLEIKVSSNSRKITVATARPLEKKASSSSQENAAATARPATVYATSSNDQSNWDRPLPLPPARTDSVNIELLEARKEAQSRKQNGGSEDSPSYLNRMVSHIDRLIQPGSSPIRSSAEKRVASAPVATKYVDMLNVMPSIHETLGESFRASDGFGEFMREQRQDNNVVNRHTSAPGSSADHHKLRERQSRGSSIRVVQPSSPVIAKPPAPLNIRKKTSLGGQSVVMSGARLGNDTPELGLHQQYTQGSISTKSPELGQAEKDYDVSDPFVAESFNGTIRKKPSSWFKRNGKGAEDDKVSDTSASKHSPSPKITQEEEFPHRIGNGSVVSRKISFGLGKLFRKSTLKQDKEGVNGFAIFDETVDSSVQTQRRLSQVTRNSDYEDVAPRQIAPQRNWLARMFHVKPVSKVLCFSVSKRRARQEITALLKEWRRYGMYDVIVDKQRNVVFGRVGAKNSLSIKEVSFASEIMTVIEHGKRAQLSIAHFTQEKGAASSFYKVVETLETVMRSRGMLVADERKQKMMIKTLNG